MCVLAFVPFIAAARYAVFSDDDFSNVLAVAAKIGETHVVRVIQDVVSCYMEWQGTWFSMLVSGMLNPLHFYSYTMLRLILMGLLVCSFSALLFLSHEINAYFGLGKKTIFIFALLLLPMLSYREYTDIYLWYTGAMVYQMPCIMLLLSLAFMFRSKRKSSRFCLALAVIGFICVGGGILSLGGVAAWFLLVICVSDWLHSRKMDKVFAAMFVVMVVADLINVVAPGNYARNSLMGGLNVLGSLFAAVRLGFDEYAFLFKDTGFVLFFILACVMGVFSGKKLQGKHIAVVSVALFLTPMVALFPQVLGYNSISISFDSLPGRTCFVIDAAAIASMEIVAFLIGTLLSDWLLIKSEARTRKLLLSLAVAVSLGIGAFSLGSCLEIKIVRNLLNGEIEKYSTGWHEIYDLLRDSPGDDIVLVNIPEPCDGTYAVSYGAYPTHDTNMKWCSYFGTNSVCTGYYAYNMDLEEN